MKSIKEIKIQYEGQVGWWRDYQEEMVIEEVYIRSDGQIMVSAKSENLGEVISYIEDVVL